ncbi:hypothetical protein [Staphylococcus phage vB_ScaM-V1SC01]|nr:hypothetical protein [Staphylococcus phage vB_ScaM-V1SC01]WPF67606.1 hypothetical protein [Staphylococcus phage vB_SauM-V1SA12]WPH67155.1 hypothetical protein CUBB_gp239c [Staphylococcus phage CUB-B]
MYSSCVNCPSITPLSIIMMYSIAVSFTISNLFIIINSFLFYLLS